jgi:hypothetical protein
MLATKYETFVDVKKEKEKVEKVQGQLDGDLEKIKSIFSIYSDILACRAPTNNYALFLLE